jgi:lysophospholipase L1-like esterase
MGKRRTHRARILAVILGAILVAELAGHLVGPPPLPPTSAFIEAQEWRYPDWVQQDRDLFWRYRPSRVIDGKFIRPGRYTINTHGYRGTDYPIDKPAGVTRVVCLGESNTFGLGVSDEAVWPRHLERRLNALDPQKRRWEVLNLAVTNYSTVQGVRQARQELPRLKPDIVLFSYSWADHQPAANGIADDQLQVGFGWQVALNNWLHRSALVRWLKAGWSAMAPPSLPAQAPPGFNQRRVATTEYSENIERLTRESLAVGARPVLVTSPIAWPPEGMTDTSGIFHVHHRYRRLARFGALAAGGEFVELANVFDEFPRFYDKDAGQFELFNAQGHEFTGEFLARYLLGDSIVVARYGSRIYTQGR